MEHDAILTLHNKCLAALQSGDDAIKCLRALRKHILEFGVPVSPVVAKKVFVKPFFSLSFFGKNFFSLVTEWKSRVHHTRSHMEASVAS